MQKRQRWCAKKSEALPKLLFCVLMPWSFWFLLFLRSRCSRVVRSLRPYWHGWRKLSKLTNHRVYQELLYWNDILKTMLTGSTYPSLPSSPRGFPAAFLDALSPLSWSLEQSIRLRLKKTCHAYSPSFVLRSFKCLIRSESKTDWNKTRKQMRQAAFVSPRGYLPRHDHAWPYRTARSPGRGREGGGGVFRFMVDTGSLRPKGVP